MTHAELMSIGVFARRSGLTASALRFYADAGVLPPAEIDPSTGYRSYAADQVQRAVLLRRLREIGMPLSTVATALDDETAAVRLIDEHISDILDGAERAQATARQVTASFQVEPLVSLGRVSGPLLATALDQALAAAAPHPTGSSLAGVRVEAEPGSLTLMATDRYRLARRTVAVDGSSGTSWSGTAHGDDVRAAAGRIRRSATVEIGAGTHGIVFGLADGEQHVRVVSEDFPDVHRMLNALSEVTTRVTVVRATLLNALEQHGAPDVMLQLTEGRLFFGAADPPPSARELEAEVSGVDLRIRFATTTLYPAVAAALGPEVMVDLRGASEPATIRSADRGDLTTLAMPLAPDAATPTGRTPV